MTTAGSIVGGVVVEVLGGDVVVAALVEVEVTKVVVVGVAVADVDHVAEGVEVVVDAPVSTVRSSRRAKSVTTSATAIRPITPARAA